MKGKNDRLPEFGKTPKEGVVEKEEGLSIDNLTGISIKSDFWSMFSIKAYVINLLMMSVAWASSSFALFMIGFYIKYIPGDMFTNVILSCTSEACACIISGFVAVFLGTKNTLFVSFFIGAVFGGSLVFIDPSNVELIIVCLILTKFGVASSVNLCFLVTNEYFPIVYSATVFGACSLFARVISMFSPIIAEIDNPLPMLIYTLFCIFSMIGTSFLTKNKKAEQEIDEAMIMASPINVRRDN